MSYDIQEVLKSVQGGAPAPYTTTDDIIARVRRIRRRRAVAAGAAGVAACLGVMLAAVHTLPGGDTLSAAQPSASGPTGPVTTPSPLPVKKVDFSSTLGDYRVGAYQVGPVGQITAGYQQIPVYRDGDVWTDTDGRNYPYAGATITVYGPGVWDPGNFTFGEDSTLRIGERYTVDVGGRPAFAIDMTYLSPVDKVTKYVRTALAWQYRDGAWATLVPSYDHAPLSRADAVRISAKLVTAAKKQQLKVPYKLGYLPPGWQAIAVKQTAAATSSEQSDVYLHAGPVADPATTVDEVLPGNVKIVVSTGKPKDPLAEGLNCFAGHHSCTIKHGDYLIGVGDFNSVVPDATIRKIAEGLQLKDLTDQNTWVPVNG